MKRFVYQQLLPITALLACLSVPVQAASITIKDLTVNITDLINPSSSPSANCDEKNLTTLRFALNDKVIVQDLMLTPVFFEVGELVSIDLVEDLRVCSRHHRVDLWVGIKLPKKGGYLFLIETDYFPFFSFSVKPQPFRTDLESSNHPISVFPNYEIRKGLGGNYGFYAAYTETGTDISNLLFTLSSNRPSVKIMLSDE
jgi:hypothetical protein